MVVRNVLTIMQLQVREQAFATWNHIKYSPINMPKGIRVGEYFIIIIRSLLFVF